MNDNLDIKNLEDNELKQVNGGYSKSGVIEYYEVGDCFQKGGEIFVINSPSSSKENVIFYNKYDERDGGEWYAFSFSSRMSWARFKADGYTYIGKKDTCGRTFKYGPNDK